MNKYQKRELVARRRKVCKKLTRQNKIIRMLREAVGESTDIKYASVCKQLSLRSLKFILDNDLDARTVIKSWESSVQLRDIALSELAGRELLNEKHK